MHHDIDILIHPAEEPGDLDTFLTILAELIARVAQGGQAPSDEPIVDEPAPQHVLHEQPAAA